MLAQSLVDPDDRERQFARASQRTVTDDSGRGFFARSQNGGEQFRVVEVNRVHEVSAVVDQQIGLGGKDVGEVLLVLSRRLAAFGEDTVTPRSASA